MTRHVLSALEWSLLFLGASGTTGVLTGVVRKYTIAQAMIDRPVERSSHSVPTPRGGGLAITLVLLATIAGVWIFAGISNKVFAALGGGTLVIAWIGWLDDRRGTPPIVRAGVHAAAAVWAVAWLGGFPKVCLGGSAVDLGILGSLLAVVGLMWSTNLYNFMDGIDGIAGVQGMCVGFFGGILLLLAGQWGLAAVTIAISGSCAGFLYWNRTPARIFMGDVGSCSLGYVFGAMAVASENLGAVPVVYWAVLAAVFVFDATVTLTFRLIAGHSWKSAHRDHAYQRATQAGLTHMQVSVGVLLLNIVLGLLALWMWQTSTALIEGALVAFTICALCYRFVHHYGREGAVPLRREPHRG